MTMQLKLLLSGTILLLLLTVFAMVMMERGEFNSSGSYGTKAAVTEKTGMDPLKTEPRADAARQAARRSAASQEVQNETAVPQAQLDLMAKREEARQRRDEMLKMRAETIEKMGPGNTGEQQIEQ
jgi:hypothetical protein